MVHVGAHLAEEADLYAKYNFGPVIWVEAQANLAKILEAQIRPADRVIWALVWSKSGLSKTLRISNNSQSSSVFDFGTHSLSYPEVTFTDEVQMQTSALQDILPDTLSSQMLVLDIQGAEYEALQGLGGGIGMFDYVYCEVSRRGLFRETREVGHIDTLMSQSGFVRVATMWTNSDWGDALYLREDMAIEVFGGRLALNWFVFIYGLWSGLKTSSFVSFTHSLWRKLLSLSKAR